MPVVPALHLPPSASPKTDSPGSVLFDGEGFGGVAATDPEAILEGGW
jgi:hypothetical protein